MSDGAQDAPMVTIGIACYEAEETIARAVGSAAAQTWPSLEILVVDDGSGDGSLARLEGLAASEPRLRVVRREKNGGVGAVRNTILGEAKGAFVAFFDDDDVSAPDRVRRQYQRIVDYERETGVHMILCHASRQVVLPDGRIIPEPALGADATPAPHGKRVVDVILSGRPLPAGGGSAATCSQMARLSVYQSLGGFDETLRRGEDTDLNLRAAARGAHFPGLASPLVTQHMTVTDDKSAQAEAENFLRLVEKHRALLEADGRYRFTRKWVAMKYALLGGRRWAALRCALEVFAAFPLRTVQRLVWAWPNRRRHRISMRQTGAGESPK